jgi:glycosyltransferase involved in cell wall biosynthesis
MVLVSVIMGSYNHEKYIGEAIESVLNQTCKDLELIIVDDASRDNSKAIIEAYCAKDPRIRKFFHKVNLGIARTINDCLKQVNGKFVCLIDSDDLWDEHKLEKQLTVLSKNEGKLVWSEGTIVNSKGYPTGRTVTQLLYSLRKSGDLFEELLREQFVLFQSLIFETKFLNGLKRDEAFKYVSDHRFIVELAKNHEFVFMNEPLAKYRMHGTNVTRRDNKGWMRERIAIRKHFLQQYSSSISNSTRADIYHKIGHAYSNLDNQTAARYYYMKAFSIDHLHLSSALYIALALTAKNRSINELSAKLYYSLLSYLTKKISQRRILT